jgi:hypothetical protein
MESTTGHRHLSSLTARLIAAQPIKGAHQHTHPPLLPLVPLTSHFHAPECPPDEDIRSPLLDIAAGHFLPLHRHPIPVVRIPSMLYPFLSRCGEVSPWELASQYHSGEFPARAGYWSMVDE